MTTTELNFYIIRFWRVDVTLFMFVLYVEKYPLDLVYPA